MRPSTELIEKYLKKHNIYDVSSFRLGIACLAEELYPTDSCSVLSDAQLKLLKDCRDTKNRNF